MALAAAVCAVPGLASASSLDLFYERAVMTAADARCGLFEPPVASALASARAQARGAALRAGFSKDILRNTEARAAAKASSVPCASRDIAVAADRVRKAFDGYARLIRMDFPGDVAGWKADRRSRVSAARWRLNQDLRQGGDRMVFGLAGREGANALMAVARFSTDAAPYAARLVMRDDSLTSGPYLNGTGRRLDLARRISPSGAQIGFAAEARSVAGRDLLPKDMAGGWAFRFPAAAARALAELDPREAVAVDFFFPGDQTRRIYVEVGDFAAGRAFLQVASR